MIVWQAVYRSRLSDEWKRYYQPRWYFEYCVTAKRCKYDGNGRWWYHCKRFDCNYSAIWRNSANRRKLQEKANTINNAVEAYVFKQRELNEWACNYKQAQDMKVPKSFFWKTNKVYKDLEDNGLKGFAKRAKCVVQDKQVKHCSLEDAEKRLNGIIYESENPLVSGSERPWRQKGIFWEDRRWGWGNCWY